MSFDRQDTWRVMLCPKHGGLIEIADTDYCPWCGCRVGHSDPFIVERSGVTQNTEGQVSHAHGATARAAARDVTPRTGTQRRMILEWISGQGQRGATRDELATWSCKSPNTVRPRVKELLDGGYVEVKPGATRESLAGRQSEVLIATTKGVLALR